MTMTIGELINENKIVIGGEESAGLSIKGHYPQKDGILACLLAAEAVAARGAHLTDQLNDLFSRIGKLEKKTQKRLAGDGVERTNRWMELSSFLRTVRGC